MAVSVQCTPLFEAATEAGFNLTSLVDTVRVRPFLSFRHVQRTPSIDRKRLLADAAVWQIHSEVVPLTTAIVCMEISL